MMSRDVKKSGPERRVAAVCAMRWCVILHSIPNTAALRHFCRPHNSNGVGHVISVDDTRIGLRESGFLRLEYSVELLIEYLSTRMIPEVAINYRVAQHKRTPGCSFKFAIQQRFEMSQNNAKMIRKSLSSEFETCIIFTSCIKV